VRQIGLAFCRQAKHFLKTSKVIHIRFCLCYTQRRNWSGGLATMSDEVILKCKKCGHTWEKESTIWKAIGQMVDQTEKSTGLPDQAEACPNCGNTEPPFVISRPKHSSGGW
jgi:hypothetical protein